MAHILTACAGNPKHRMLLTVCYGCGLRLSELVRLQVSDIDGERRLLLGTKTQSPHPPALPDPQRSHDRPRPMEQQQGPYLFPVKALSRHFRGGFVSRLRAEIEQGEWPQLKDQQQIKPILDALMQKDWAVYIKTRLNHARTVVNYLARYTHRIAISDSRIRHIDAQGRIRLSYKDYRDHHRVKEMTLDGQELIRRFLQHVLPKGFMRVRHFGFLANGCRSKRLKQIRTALAAPEPERQSSNEEPTAFNGYPYRKCQQGRLIVVAEIAPRRFNSG